MDGNNQPGHGFLSHILDPQLGQVFNNLVRSVLTSHDQPQQPAQSALDTSAQAETTQTIAAVSMPENGNAPAVTSSSQATAEDGNVALDHSVPSPQQPSGLSVREAGARDVEMESFSGATHASASAEPSRPQPTPRNSRRPRVEDEEDEDYLREYNRQRVHSPTPRDDEHHDFMPIPAHHEVPQASQRTGPSSQPTAAAGPSPLRDGPHSPHGQMMWTFDFQSTAAPQGNAQPAQAPRPDQGHDPHNHAHLPTFNLFINIPVPGPGAQAQPGVANVHDGGNLPGQPGFMFPPFPFPLGQFGMDMVEERDDPERAQRLVDGLEEVPAGLVKRLQRVGGPGTVQGETPTCAVCWESLLEPEGGGFEGNAELARAEAAEAAREDAVSQHERESSMEVDSPASTASDASSSTTDASLSTISTPSGEKRYPKIVVLPCSHVFHASCLLPWFSKPGRTTCPSCRFDIDPDSLTYRPRPLRARRPEPQPAPQPATAPQPQQPPVYGPAPPPYAPIPPRPAPSAAQAVSNVAPAPQPEDHPAQARDAEEQPGQQTPRLPPFITFDISMIIPIFPGQPSGAPQPAPGAQPADTAAQANPQGAPPHPSRTDHNGFRLDDSVLAEAVRTTFERIFGRPAPPPQPQPQPQPHPQQTAGGAPLDWFTFAGPLPGFPPVPPPGARRGTPERPVPKRKWTLPPPPGPTLRQMVERNEREMGLRCSDVSCGLGPSDDDPTTMFDATALRQISIRPLKSDASRREAVCEHKFHPSCLVSAERVAGWGREDRKEDHEDVAEDVEVSCPVCRAVGVISRLDWEEGACALA